MTHIMVLLKKIVIGMKHKKALVEYCLNGFLNVYNDIVIKSTT